MLIIFKNRNSTDLPSWSLVHFRDRPSVVILYDILIALRLSSDSFWHGTLIFKHWSPKSYWSEFSDVCPTSVDQWGELSVCALMLVVTSVSDTLCISSSWQSNIRIKSLLFSFSQSNLCRFASEDMFVSSFKEMIALNVYSLGVQLLNFLCHWLFFSYLFFLHHKSLYISHLQF